MDVKAPTVSFENKTNEKQLLTHILKNTCFNFYVAIFYHETSFINNIVYLFHIKKEKRVLAAIC